MKNDKLKKSDYIPNSFQVPNILVDEYMTKLSGNAYKLLILIIRQTIGWQKKWDSISATQMATALNLKLLKNVYPYIKELEEFGLINIQKKQGKINRYSLYKPVPKKGTTKESTSTKKGDYPVPKKGTTTSTLKAPSTKPTIKHTIKKHKYTEEEQNEIIDSFIPNETSLQIVSEKYFDRQITQQDINALIMDFQISMRNREAKWKDIQSCFQKYTSKGWITMPEDKQMSYSDIAKALESQRNNLIIESEKGGLDGISSS